MIIMSRLYDSGVTHVKYLFYEKESNETPGIVPLNVSKFTVCLK